MKSKKQLKTTAAIAGTVMAGVFTFSSNDATANDLLEYNALGSGGEVRAELIEMNAQELPMGTFEMKCGEGKCGSKEGNKKNKENEKEENQEKEGKNEKKSEEKSEKESESKTSESKCGEGKCGG